MTQGFAYFVALFNTIFSFLKNSKVLFFIPFLIVPRLNESQIDPASPNVSEKNQDKVTILSTIKVEMDEDNV